MRQFILCSILLSFAAFINAQQTKSQATITQTDYSEKSKKQKKIGRVLLGVGAGLLVTSLIIPEGDVTEEGLFDDGLYLSDKHENDGIRAAFLVGGVLSAVASVPFFIASKKNRKRAASLGFGTERVMYPYQEGFAFVSLPALTLKIGLASRRN